MQTCAEELPFEIWLIIFKYLEAHDLFRAFQNLNSYFNQILASDYLSLYVRLKETDGNHLQHPINPYWSDSTLNRIACLRSVVQFRSTYFLEFVRWHVNKLTRLQSLSINTQPRDRLLIPHFCQSLKELHRLKCLSLTCEPSKIVFEAIFALPTLRICQLILKDSTTSISNHLLCANSPIQQLFIVFLNKIDYSLVYTMLAHTQKLKRLEISGSSFSFETISVFAEPLFTIPGLRILKLKLENGYFTPDCFQSLHSTMPALKQFYFHYNKHILTEMFLDHFITYWWSIIERIERFDIYIKGHILIDNIYPNMQMNRQKNRQILLDKIKQSNEFLKFKWSERDFVKLRLIEITIEKC